jgi:hypothetical protein
LDIEFINDLNGFRKNLNTAQRLIRITINERVKTLKVLQLSFERLLLKEGFDVIDIKNWSKRNLERIEFQKY